MTPSIPPQMVSNFEFLHGIHQLHCYATVSQELSGRFQLDRPQPMAILRIAAAVTSDPFLDALAIHRRWIVAHSLGVGDYEREGVGIFGDEFA